MTYVHNFSPFLIELNWQIGPFHLDGIRWYGLAYLTGFILGYYVIDYMGKKGTTMVKGQTLADLTTIVAIGTLLGGRIGYCLFYAPNLLTEWTNDFPFWGVLKVHQGGMASHGGIMGIMVAVWIFSRYHKFKFFHLLDLTVLGGSIGIFFGRLANYVNGELYGREAPAGLSWAVKFPQEMYTWSADQVEKLRAIGQAMGSLSPLKLSSGEAVTLTPEVWDKWVGSYRFDSQSRFMVHEAFEKIIYSIQHGNQELAMALGPFLTPRYPSQLIQALAEGLLVFIVLALIWLKPRKPGVVAAWFGFMYAVARIFGEQFRMPDAHIGYQWLGLTRGQWLSIGMLAIAIAFVLFATLRKETPTGGWGLAKKK